MAGEDEIPVEGFTPEEVKRLQRYINLRTASAYVVAAKTSISKAHAILMREHEPCIRDLEKIYFKLSAVLGSIRDSMKDTEEKGDD
nr:MAG TPA: hypothetical protein [Caudoviricetes sp.]